METIGERPRREAMSRGAWLLAAAAIIASALALKLIYQAQETSTTGGLTMLLVSVYQAPPMSPQDASFAVDHHGLEDGFYRQSCPQAEFIVRFSMARIYSLCKDVHPALLVLLYHDCFVKGCDASILLDDSNGNASHSIEKDAIPNRSLKGFDVIDMIKEELERACPGVVSCADTLALATRDGLVLAGGPFYPVFTGRRDSTESYYSEAMTEIPGPLDNFTQTLDSFSRRGFDDEETVTLLERGHLIGKIYCDSIKSHSDTETEHQPDPSTAPDSDYLNQLKLSCQDYDENFVAGRDRLIGNQQLMANNRTARIVRDYASSDRGMINFRRDFARAMAKTSNLNVLTGDQGQVRRECSSSPAATN